MKLPVYSLQIFLLDDFQEFYIYLIMPLTSSIKPFMNNHFKPLLLFLNEAMTDPHQKFQIDLYRKVTY